jgi:Domain of unknown function (DUF4157)
VPRRLDAGDRTQFTHVSVQDLDRARLVTVPVLTPGIGGMTLGRWILLRRGHEHDRDLIAHELVHVRQWRELGAVRFLLRYLGAYARGRLRGLGHQGAYEAIPLEAEARRAVAGR